MAQNNFRTNISLNKKQLLEAKLQVIAGSHSSPEEGMIWYNSTTGVKRPEVHNGSAVKRLAFTDDVQAASDAATLQGATLAQVRDRGTHTGTQTAATISDFAAAVAAAIPSAYATDAEVTTAINNVLNGAPAALDTLDELAAALGDDASFATNITNLVNARAKHYSQNIGDGSTLAYTVTHNLNTRATTVSLMDNTTFEEFDAQVSKPTVNTHVITFDAPAPAANSVLVTITGK